MADSIVRELRDARAMTGTTRIRILRADSHPIVEHMGLAHRCDGDFDVLEARVHGFADFDFTLHQWFLAPAFRWLFCYKWSCASCMIITDAAVHRT